MSELTRYSHVCPTTAQTCSSNRLVSGEHSSLELMRNFRSDFPNLPGFTRHSNFRLQGPRNQTLHFMNGYRMVNIPTNAITQLDSSVTWDKPRPFSAPSLSFPTREVVDPADLSGRYSLSRQRKDRENNKITLPFQPNSKLPAFLEHDRCVLLFKAYYQEEVHQSAIETQRIQICEIFFYVEDGTLEIIRTKQDNSGMPQGVFLRRSRVENKMNETGRFFEVDDFKMGTKVDIYSRTFCIFDCNKSTKEYVMSHHGWTEDEVVACPLPRDNFAEVYKDKMRRESGVPGVDRKRKMHELKEVMESMLGRHISNNDRGMFLECGQDALCFHAVWDDRQRLFGDMQFFRLFYYLADGTIEIHPIHKKNGGRDQVPKLLKRIRLPKHGTISHGDEALEYYSWEDLGVGIVINVLGRFMLLARCDSFTRQYYESKGIHLSHDCPLEPDEVKVEIIRHIPPYNGFGSEDDSLRSCSGRIYCPPVKKDFSKMRDKQGSVLRFSARLLSDTMNRRFVIQYFMEDDTIDVHEPPIRNSGILGGIFLGRQKVKKSDMINYSAMDMYVGNFLDLFSHRFEILDADEHTYRLMENDKMFLYSNFTKLHEIITPKVSELRQYFVKHSYPDDKMDVNEFSTLWKNVGLDLNKQQVLTLWRKLDRKGKGKVTLNKIVKMASDDLFDAHIG